MQQWNFDIQQDLGSGFVIDAAYAASKGTKLPHALGINQLPNQYLNLGVALNDPVANPFHGLVKTARFLGRPFHSSKLYCFIHNSAVCLYHRCRSAIPPIVQCR